MHAFRRTNQARERGNHDHRRQVGLTTIFTSTCSLNLDATVLHTLSC